MTTTTQRLAFAAIFAAMLSIAPSRASEQTFRYEDAEASKVELLGEFNNWEAVPMTRQADGAWTTTLDLPEGDYGYKFLINGENWAFDPTNPSRKTVNGIENSSILVYSESSAPSTPPTPSTPPAPTPAAEAAPAEVSGSRDWTFTYSDPQAQAVYVTGSFNAWNTESHPMTRNEDGVWTATVQVEPGETTYKFIVDGEWKTDPANTKVSADGRGGNNSVMNPADH